jgi:predicted kinase
MVKVTPFKPLFILLYGFPGSGKTFFARQICEQFAATHVQSDRIRAELFSNPTYSKDENHVVTSLMNYMTGEFLSAGVSVVYDVNALRTSQRRALRNMALKAGAEAILVWQQIDAESAFARTAKRDRRKADDRYAQELTRPAFDQLANAMQNPDGTERYLVISGKHVFNTQKSAFFRYLQEHQLIDLDPNTQAQISKPGLVNLIPNPRAGRVDFSRRNITIR